MKVLQPNSSQWAFAVNATAVIDYQVSKQLIKIRQVINHTNRVRTSVHGVLRKRLPSFYLSFCPGFGKSTANNVSDLFQPFQQVKHNTLFGRVCY